MGGIWTMFIQWISNWTMFIHVYGWYMAGNHQSTWVTTGRVGPRVGPPTWCHPLPGAKRRCSWSLTWASSQVEFTMGKWGETNGFYMDYMDLYGFIWIKNSVEGIPISTSHYYPGWIYIYMDYMDYMDLYGSRIAWRVSPYPHPIIILVGFIFIWIYMDYMDLYGIMWINNSNSNPIDRYWLVVDLPLWKILKNNGEDDIPYMKWKNMET